jgi:hypothetical protein
VPSPRQPIPGNSVKPRSIRGARAYRDSTEDASADVGFELGDVHFEVLVTKYIASASPLQVLGFYRKALSRYGEVLECEYGRTVGSLSKTRGGLTCSDNRGEEHVHAGDSVRQLRAGTSERFRIVAVEPARDGATKFTLLLLDVPKIAGEARR